MFVLSAIQVVLLVLLAIDILILIGLGIRQLADISALNKGVNAGLKNYKDSKTKIYDI